MKRLLLTAVTVLAAAIAAAGAVVAAYEYESPSTPEKSAALAVSALKAGNYGEFCGLVSETNKDGGQEGCVIGMVNQVAQSLWFYGINVFVGLQMVSDEAPVELPDGTVSVHLEDAADLLPDVWFILSQDEDGVWRVVKFAGENPEVAAAAGKPLAEA